MSLLQAIGFSLYLSGHGTSMISGGNPLGPIMMIVGGILVFVGALMSV